MGWIELLFRRVSLRRFVGAFAGVLMLIASGHTWAAATCTGTANTYTLSMPTSVAVPRDAAVGTMLTGWVSSPAVTNYYNCTVTSSSATGAVFEQVSLTPSGVTVTANGLSTVVFNTNIPGVGVAIQARTYANGCGWQSWIDIDAGSWNGSACNNNGTVTNGGQAMAALVKTGPITGGTVAGGVVMQAAAYVISAVQSPYMSFALTSTAVTVMSCITPNVTVPMGSNPAASFKGAGSTTSPVGFNVALNSCPAGMNSIQYSFDAPGGVVNAANGVIALSSDSTATGVGLQLQDSTGKALQFGTQYTLSGYSRATGGAYTIPLKAAYSQLTGKAVTAGTANGLITFTMTYQ